MNEKRRVWPYWLAIIGSSIALQIMVASCRTIYVDRPVVHTEIEYRERVDSVNIHDSVYIHEIQKGDTVTRIEYRYRDRFQYISLIDTVAIRDTVTVVNERVVEKEVARMNDFQRTFFWIGVIGILLLFIYIALRVFVRR